MIGYITFVGEVARLAEALVGGLLLTALAGVFTADLGVTSLAGVFAVDLGVATFLTALFLPVDFPTLLFSLLTTLPSFSNDWKTGRSSTMFLIGDFAGDAGLAGEAGFTGDDSFLRGECFPDLTGSIT